MFPTLSRRHITRVLLLACLLCLFGGGSAAGYPGSLPAAIESLLEQPELPGSRFDGDDLHMREELERFYRERDYRPAWDLVDPQGRRQVEEMLGLLRASMSEGMCGTDYHLHFFEELTRLFALGFDDPLQPRLRWTGLYDVLLTDALFSFAAHLLQGRVAADDLQAGWDTAQRRVDLVKLIRHAVDERDIGQVLSGLMPPHRGYFALRRALAGYRELQAKGGWPQIPDGDPIRPGQVDPRVELVRIRLVLSGDLPALRGNEPPELGEADVAAVKAFQRRHGLFPDGIVGGRTLAAMNVPVRERIRQLELNMERWRWLPKDLGQRHILVNIADYRVRVMEGDEEVLSMAAVVGTRYRKTPVFSGWMSYLEFAPYWYVPPTILVEDKLPKIKADPAYLEDNHYELLRWDAVTPLESEEIDWSTVDAESFPGLLRQKPGPWNALGEVKFMFPNRHAIYLHDTPRRDQFWRQARSFSSGCIRLEKPALLAEYLLQDLGWDRQAIEKAMAGAEPKRVDLQYGMPVHILYWTAWVDDAGTVHFREDIYNRDAALDLALQKVSATCISSPVAGLERHGLHLHRGE